MLGLMVYSSLAGVLRGGFDHKKTAFNSYHVDIFLSYTGGRGAQWTPRTK